MGHLICGPGHEIADMLLGRNPVILRSPNTLPNMLAIVMVQLCFNTPISIVQVTVPESDAELSDVVCFILKVEADVCAVRPSGCCNGGHSRRLANADGRLPDPVNGETVDCVGQHDSTNL